MSLHRDRYLAGACEFVGVHHIKGGREVRLFDRQLRLRKIAQALRRRGHRPPAIATLLAEPLPLVEKLIARNPFHATAKDAPFFRFAALD